MGRTFGLLIVSIGLWLVFSLPTRGPATDNASSVVVAVPAPVPVTQPSAIAGVSSVAGAETRSTTLGGPATAAAILPSVILSRPDERTAAAPIVTRPKRGQDERAVAARNREFESEPEVATARPPEPVAVTAINGLSVTLESKTARIVVPSDAQSGQIRIMPTAVAPAPSAPGSASPATSERPLPSASESPVPASPPAGVTAPAPNPAPVSPASGSGSRGPTRGGTRVVGDRTFRLVAGEWIDAAYDPLGLLPVEVIDGQEARAAVVTRVPALAPYAALGARVVVVQEGVVYRFRP